MQRKNRLIWLPVILVLVLISQAVSADRGIPVKVAVIPFEVFSAADESGLGNVFAVQLSNQLAVNPNIYVTKMDDVLSVLKSGESVLDAERLKEIAKLLSANFILFGSVTKINANISVDVQLFNNFPPEGYAKSFAEGTDNEVLIEALSGKVELEILDKSEFVPLSQRVKIASKTVEQMDEDFIFDMEGKIGEKKKEVVLVKTRAADGSLEKLEEEKVSLEDELEDEFLSEKSVEKENIEITEIAKKEVEETDLDAPDDLSDEDISDVVRIKPKKRSKKRAFMTNKPVNINADSLEYDNSENRIIFSGNVVARQGDIVMFADKMNVLYAEEGDLHKIAASGNVKVTQGERIATGKNIVFYNQSQKIVVTGNPRVWQGDNVIQGKKITVFLKEDRSVVEGGPDGRVNATIYPGRAKP